MMYNFFLAIYKDNKETAISKYHNLALLQSWKFYSCDHNSYFQMKSKLLFRFIK